MKIPCYRKKITYRRCTEENEKKINTYHYIKSMKYKRRQQERKKGAKKLGDRQKTCNEKTTVSPSLSIMKMD